MAAFVFTDAVVTINGTAMTSYVKEVKLDFEVSDNNTTVFGSTWNSRIGGLKDGSVGVKFNQDFASSTVDPVIWPLLGTVVAFKVKATSAANSATNPEYQFNVLISEWSPFGGAVGDLAEVDVTWPISGSVTRATA